MITKKEQLLAALIFVLWSLGVMVIPAVGSSAFTLSQGAVMILSGIYALLHVVVAIFALSALVEHVRKPRGKGWRRYFPTVLYIYAIGMLAYSIYLLAPAF